MVEKWRAEWIEKAQRLQLACEIRIIAHRKKAEYWNKLAIGFGLSTTIISTITTLSLVTTLPNYEQNIAPYLAALVTIASTLNAFLKTGDTKINNEISYKLYSALSIDIKFFYEIKASTQTWKGIPEAQKDLADSYKILNDRLNQLVYESPMLTTMDIEKAKQELEIYNR